MPLTMTPSAAAAASLDDLAAARAYARRGDPRAFETLVHRYQAMVLATCRRALGNDADADDATQETFLKLSRSAGDIRSNIAAWLHACALRTSIDLMRRNGVRRRAEAAAKADAAKANDESHLIWSELESELDAALARLDDADRELIVSRFLAGRSQVEMAEQAGVSPGTMHRRIDRALSKLRAELNSSGLAIAGGGVLAGALVHAGAAGVVSGELSASLVKIGLSGMACTPGQATTLPAGKAITAAAIVLTLAGGVATTVLTLGGGSTPATPTPLAALTAVSETPRPKRTSKPYDQTRMTVNGKPSVRLLADDEHLHFTFNLMDHGQPAEMELVIDSVNDDADPPIISTRVTNGTRRPGDPAVTLAGRDLDASYTLENGRLHMWTTFMVGDQEMREDFYGIRVAEDDPDAADRVAANSEIAGVWHGLNDWRLIVSKSDLRIYSESWGDDFSVYRFHILNWTDMGDHARVESIIADAANAQLIGERARVLVKKSRSKDTEAYTIVFNNAPTGRINEWPTTFEPGEGLVTMTYERNR